MRIANPAATTSEPVHRVILGPNRRDISAETGDRASWASPLGSRHRPPTTMDAPKPYPEATGACT